MRIRLLTSIIFLALITLLSPVSGQTGHSITVTAPDAPSVKLRLAYHVGNQQYVRDSLVTDAAGKGRFMGGDKLPAGVYMIVLPENIFFEFLLGEDQHFDIKFSKSDPITTLSFTGSEENSRFVAYQRKWKSLQEDAMRISSRLNGLQPGSPDAAAARRDLAEQETKMKQYLRETSDANKGTLLGAV
ncbi:hypothetical protein EG830_16435, partial [bacterium]|nr:hypothetical protein [bacterium]